MPIPTIDELMTMEVGSYELVPTGHYLGVITNVEVREGRKGPYLNLEVTIHEDADGDTTHQGKRAWRVASFSEKALAMPGGVAELVQVTQPDIPSGTDPDDLPNVLATLVQGEPVGFEIEHNQRYKNGKPQVDPTTGEPVLKEDVAYFFSAPDSFTDNLELEAQGVDSDLPF